MNHYFQNHNYKPEKHTPSQQQQQPNSHCANDRPLRKEPLSRNDIDMLQLMNPNMTPEQYLLQITELYHKEQNIKTREDNNKPMQLALSTRKIIENKAISPGDQGEGNEEEDEEGEGSPQHHSSDKNYQEHLQNLREQCYLSLGKLIISRKEKNNRVELNKANYHTRQYLLPNAKEEM